MHEDSSSLDIWLKFNHQWRSYVKEENLLTLHPATTLLTKLKVEAVKKFRQNELHLEKCQVSSYTVSRTNIERLYNFQLVVPELGVTFPALGCKLARADEVGSRAVETPSTDRDAGIAWDKSACDEAAFWRCDSRKNAGNRRIYPQSFVQDREEVVNIDCYAVDFVDGLKRSPEA